ncbi:transcription initiation factor tfiid subunit 5 [Colletotrichum scovillei]|uniref:Transcription initiation factor tfiid subunit 5 n=1 Tax=Colletotrichum scovillei TaxID=1209932 RepID=A0A9P7REC5_9PEZI|nr:transcription initiation factor tfiid subunit 5 [Colletotrichum scovillei]KAG7075200.1 transcription initiation factor tfiid subunit 5 [Colletotrichum scovillei]KAG7082484.1 transcription initiation factor tfiid subunit 5 [Colletotrichum scovillei]
MSGNPAQPGASTTPGVPAAAAAGAAGTGASGSFSQQPQQQQQQQQAASTVPATVTPIPAPTVPTSQTPIPPPVTATPAPAAAPATAPMSNQNLNQIVTDYLLKRGYTRTETIFRQESSHLGPDGRPIHNKVDDLGPKKYLKAFNLLREWVENNLDIYKFELNKLLWPVFVYSWLELVTQNYSEEAKIILNNLKSYFENVHSDDLKTFSTITLALHAKENPTTKLYRENKYRVPLNQHISGNLFHFLERERDNGGAVILYILSTFCQLDSTARGPIEPFSFEAIYRRSQNLDIDEVDLQEGIPGVFTGISNRDLLDKTVPLKLGPLPMEEDLRDDVRAELQDEDALNPPPDGRATLVDEFDRKIKREESADGPTRADLPLPPSRARDVVMEMQKVRENRDRFKIDGRTGGVGVPVSACIVSCMDFSKDHEMVAIGTTDSYIRVWHLEGKPLKSKRNDEKDYKFNNRKLIGHSAQVYSVSFSDAIAKLEHAPFGEEGKGESPIETSSKLLLSCSADGTVRVWSLDVWACVCVYKGHDGPVLRAEWGPFGHYFLTGGWDKTVRVWMQDHASAQRILVGHDSSISAVAWHPNGTYVFSASDETDKSVRMWSVITGQCVRVFTGHTDYISTIEVAPNGRILATADCSGNIFFWDIQKGLRIKRSRGHGKGGIWSMSFSVESNVLVSGGQDGTVRVWDVELPAEGHKAAQQQQGAAPAQEGGDTIVAASGQTDRPTASGQGATGSGSNAPSGGKKKGKEVMITPDQISAFPTKKTPVMKVQFTRMNLIVSGGCYDPDR